MKSSSLIGDLSSRRVLVTDGRGGQSRSALAAVRALAAGGYRASVTTSGALSLAAASRFCEAAIPVPSVDHPNYGGEVHDLLARGRYLTFLPTSDAALLALKLPVQHLIDKEQLSKKAAGVGLAVLPTTTYESPDELLDDAENLSYPIVIKPTISSASAMRVGAPERVPEALQGSGPYLVQPYLDKPMSAVGGLVWRGAILGAVHMQYLRTWPTPCGTSCASVTVEVDEGRERRLTELLGAYDGLFQAQFVGNCIIDLNLRVYGSLPLSVASGVNLVGMYCDLLRGQPVSRRRGTPGVRYRWMEGDVRHVWQKWRTRDMSTYGAVRALAPRWRTAHSVVSLSDPGPLLSRIRYGLSHI